MRVERRLTESARLLERAGRVIPAYTQTLSKNPTLDEVATKAKALTGTDPVTGQQTYGYYYQGKYAVWQFLTLAHAMGANWGEVDAEGKMHITWDTPEYLKALENAGWIGVLGLALNAHQVGRRTGAVSDAHLQQDRRYVILDGLLRQVEIGCDFPVGLRHSDLGEDDPLAVG